MFILSPVVSKVLETEETRELVKAYALLVGQLADFENEKIEVPLHQKSKNSVTSIVSSTFIWRACCRRWICFAFAYVGLWRTRVAFFRGVISCEYVPWRSNADIAVVRSDSVGENHLLYHTHHSSLPQVTHGDISSTLLVCRSR